MDTYLLYTNCNKIIFSYILYILFGRCYECSTEHSYLIFEDLSMRDYGNSNKSLGLSVEQFKLILSKLAKWHAATAVLVGQDYAPLIHFQEHSMKQTRAMEMLLSNAVQSFADITKLLPGYEKVSRKLDNVKRRIYDKTLKAVEQDQLCFLSLCHGDLWSNNIMFASDENGHAIDAVFVDYQVSFLGPVVVDLANALYSSSNKDMRAAEWDALVQYYHGELLSMLRNLNYSKPLPTLTDIQAQLLQKGVSNAILALMTCGGRGSEEILGKLDMTILIGNSEKDKEFRLKMFASIGKNEMFQFMLNYFDRRGYFD